MNKNKYRHFYNPDNEPFYWNAPQTHNVAQCKIDNTNSLPYPAEYSLTPDCFEQLWNAVYDERGNRRDTDYL